MIIETRIRVIYGDTDQMGVVYYANYFRYFEAARGEYLRVRGGSYQAMEQDGLMLPVVEALCRYKAPARYEDVLVIRTKVDSIRRASLLFTYDVVRESDGKLLSTGSTTHACVGRDGRPFPVPDSLRALLAPEAAPDETQT